MCVCDKCREYIYKIELVGENRTVGSEGDFLQGSRSLSAGIINKLEKHYMYDFSFGINIITSFK